MRIIQDREEKQSAELYLQNDLLNETSTTEIAIYFSLAGFTRHPFFESSSLMGPKTGIIQVFTLESLVTISFQKNIRYFIIFFHGFRRI